MNEVAELDGADASAERVNQNGQRIGAKGQRTRQKLIDVTVALLETRGLRDLTVAEVARVAKTSPATFYVYFDGVPEVVLSALETASQTSPRLLELLDEPWDDRTGPAKAREFVQLYCAIWHAHKSVFRVRNLAAEEGDMRFVEARHRVVRDLLERLGRRVEDARKGGRVPQALKGSANAAAILILLERLAAVSAMTANQDGPNYDDIQESAASMIAHALGAI